MGFVFNPLPDMPILGSSNSATNKDMIERNVDKWGYNYVIEYKTLWEKEKLLVTSNFSFSHNVFKSCLVLMCQNKYLWTTGLKGRKWCLVKLSPCLTMFEKRLLFASGKQTCRIYMYFESAWEMLNQDQA